jgi:dipeptidyl aminopeptidase/acylaminoacyl peptidase
MMRLTKNQVLRPALLALLLALAACPAGEQATTVAYEFESIYTTVSSRGVAIPVTYVHPVPRDDETFPLVVMAHGHGGTRNEAGGFTRVAEGLATLGIASIRMDFPGCGDSTESFRLNTLGNMLDDIQASRDFALTRSNINRERVGLFGFSMGGRLVLLLSSLDKSYKAIATWAPAGANGADSEVDFLGGGDAYTDLRKRAMSEGFVPFTTQWGQDQELSAEWFRDMEQSNPLDAVREFEGPLLVLSGDLDDVVLPRITEGVIAAAVSSPDVVRHVVKGADHGLGLFTDEFDLSEEAVATTVDFLSTRL